MTYTVALTGGIGSGKSTAALFFAELGVPIIDSDIIARELVAPGRPALTKIIQQFGTDYLQDNGELNRLALRELIFNDPKHKQWLEQLLHPLIQQAIILQLSQIHDKYCIIVIPLLAEHFKMYQSIIDHVIVMDIDEHQQHTWAMSRDKANKDQIQKIIHSQASRQKRLSIADTVLHNDGTTEQLKSKVINFHKSLMLKTLS